MPTKQMIHEHVNAITSGLKNQDQAAIIKACTEFGMFFQNNFPGKNLEDILKLLKGANDYHSGDSAARAKFENSFQKNFPGQNLEEVMKLFEGVNQYKNQELVSVDILYMLSQARTIVHMRECNNPDPNHPDNVIMNAMKLGMSVFENLLGHERLEPKYKSYVTCNFEKNNKEKFDNAEKVVTDFLQQSLQERADFDNHFNEINLDCDQTRERLRQMIIKEMHNVQFGLTQLLIYCPKATSNVDSLVNDYMNKTGAFKDNEIYTNISEKLALVIKDYHAIQNFQKSLENVKNEENPTQKLKALTDSYHQLKAKSLHSESSHPTTLMQRFISKIDYVLIKLSTAFSKEHTVEQSPNSSQPKAKH